MTGASAPLPDLEQRFLEPPGWQWGEFERAEGRRIRYGFVIPDDARAVVRDLFEGAEMTRVAATVAMVFSAVPARSWRSSTPWRIRHYPSAWTVCSWEVDSRRPRCPG